MAGKSNSSRSRLRGARGMVIDGFPLPGGHRSCCAFHCRVRLPHLSARKTSESDGLIVNSMERLACTVSPPPCFVGGERGHCRFLVFFILDPETRKNKFISPSLFPLLCRFTRKIRRENPDSTPEFLSTNFKTSPPLAVCRH